MNEDFRLSPSLCIRDGFLFCEGVQIKALQDSLSSLFPSHSSPCFVYSQNQILENIEAYLGALKTSGIQCNLGYSMKANYNPEIVRLAGEAGCWAVAVSGFEVTLALQQGIQPQNIILNGNGKQNWEIETAVKHGCLINVDSTFDLKNIIKISDKLKSKVRVLVRLNPDIDANVHPFLATGMAKSKFGIEDSQLFDLLDIIKNNVDIELIGLHCHLGSTIDNTHVFSECLDVMINLADKVRQKGFTSVSLLNLGGGLGIDYRKHEQRTKASEPVMPGESVAEEELMCLIDKVQASCEEKSDEICQLLSIAAGSPNDFHRDNLKRLNELLAEHKEILVEAKSIIPSLNTQINMPSPYELIASVQARLNETGYHLILEPGRSLVGNSGTLITKVIGVKRNGSQRYIVVDGSMTEVIRPALYGAYHHIELAEPSLFVTDENGKQLKDSFSVVGPVCECGDFLGKDRVLPVPHEGCGLVVFDTGAYCSSMASNYNMRPRPIEVMVDGKQWRVIRRPETLENILGSFVQK